MEISFVDCTICDSGIEYTSAIIETTFNSLFLELNETDRQSMANSHSDSRTTNPLVKDQE